MSSHEENNIGHVEAKDAHGAEHDKEFDTASGVREEEKVVAAEKVDEKISHVQFHVSDVGKRILISQLILLLAVIWSVWRIETTEDQRHVESCNRVVQGRVVIIELLNIFSNDDELPPPSDSPQAQQLRQAQELLSSTPEGCEDYYTKDQLPTLDQLQIQKTRRENGDN